ncbi:MAG: T9SS type A sorting domain-containing protein [Bacteroidales bacterium]|nr:T9SS type A sorting domain-containing protein [Bacteroidales bacterium]
MLRIADIAEVYHLVLMVFIYSQARMEVVGTDGTVICRRDLRKGSNAVDLGQLDAGIFFLRIRTDSETLFRKLVKQ